MLKLFQKGNPKNENMEKRKTIFQRKQLNKKYLKNGSYSIAITAIFVVMVVIVNLMAGELPSKYTQIDVSEEKLYSIGSQTEEILQNLDKDVTIYQIVQSGSEDENISTLLQRYSDGSRHVKVEVVDPVVTPQFTSLYTNDPISSNSLIVVCEDRNKVVEYTNMYESDINYETYSYETTGFDGEGQITSAISYVTSEDLPVLYTLEGHGEQDLPSYLKEDIQKANMDIQTLNLISEGKVPEDADCLMILSPASDISSDEKTALLNYLENGGKAMIFTDYTEEPLDNLMEIYQNYGISVCEGMVFEEDNQKYAMQMPYYLLPDLISTEATSDIASAGYYILAPYAQGIQKSEDVRDTLKIESILQTTEKSYSKTDLSSTQMEKESQDVDGPFDIGVCITETSDEEEEGAYETRLVCYSTSAITDTQVNQMVSGGNEQMIMETLNWLTSSKDSGTHVSIPLKGMEVSYLTMTDYDSSTWKLISIGMIPGLFLVMGFVVWSRRRKA